MMSTVVGCNFSFQRFLILTLTCFLVQYCTKYMYIYFVRQFIMSTSLVNLIFSESASSIDKQLSQKVAATVTSPNQLAAITSLSEPVSCRRSPATVTSPGKLLTASSVMTSSNKQFSLKRNEKVEKITDLSPTGPQVKG